MIKISRFTLAALLIVAIGIFVGALTLSLRSSSAAGPEPCPCNEPDFPKLDTKPNPRTETFNDCPPEGKESADPVHPFDPDLNKLKNRIDEPQEPIKVTIDQILSLPKIAAEKLKDPRANWSPMTLAAVQQFEGTPVTVEGFLAGVREEGAESCNCGATAPSRVDWHCWLAKSAPEMVKDVHHGVETTGDELGLAVVCETTPRVRGPWPSTGTGTSRNSKTSSGRRNVCESPAGSCLIRFTPISCRAPRRLKSQDVGRYGKCTPSQRSKSRRTIPGETWISKTAGRMRQPITELVLQLCWSPCRLFVASLCHSLPGNWIIRPLE